MSAKYFSKSDFGLSHQGQGFLQQDDYQTLLFSAFMDAKGGNGGSKGGPPAPQPDPTPPDSFLSGDPLVDDSVEFNIRINFSGEWTDDLKDAFTSAANFLSALITNDIAPDGYDDITISAELTNIDGSGGILGQAGPTYIWNSNNLSSQAVMQFDVADATDFDNLGLWDDIVLHEMLHCIGFGTLWDYLGGLVETQVDDNGTKKPTDDIVSSVFVGTNAAYYSDLLFGDEYPLIETDGGSGTAGGHWDEATYDNELMTGWIDASNFLSLMSYGALDDMGYDINYAVTLGDYFLV